MSKQKKQQYDGVVYSTSDQFEYQQANPDFQKETLPNEKQKVKVGLDKKARKGKVVTIITGFIGSQEDLDALAKTLKQRCGVGGSAKEGEILIQGDFKEKIIQFLQEQKFQVKSFGG